MFNCCSQCVSTCVWGQVFNELGRCVSKPSELGKFILMEIHPGSSCLFPGLDQGECQMSTQLPHDSTLEPSREGNSPGYVLPLILFAIAILTFVFLLVAVKLFKRPAPDAVTQPTAQSFPRMENRYETIHMNDGFLNTLTGENQEDMEVLLGDAGRILDGYSLVDLSTPIASPRQLPTPPERDPISFEEINTPNASHYQDQ